MITHAHAIIGSNHGDEGKGLITDYYARRCSPRGTLVVRYNGGAQAGHTVQTQDGRRHAFAHHGSGAFAGAETLLSRHFIVSPTLLARETAMLSSLGVHRPKLWVDPRALLATPYDQLLNNVLEQARGINRHGSVGVGINETLVRSRQPELLLTAQDLDNPRRLGEVARAIKEHWVPQRLEQLGLTDTDPRLLDSWYIDHWLTDVHHMAPRLILLEDTTVLRLSWEQVLFEGAQGLLLDEQYGTMPYCTPSRPGLHNVVQLLEEAGYRSLEATYVTRAYNTRHGAGPLAHQLPPGELPYLGVQDLTNTPNTWQGHLRYAYLDLQRWGHVVRTDQQHAASSTLALTVVAAVTCLDQLAGQQPRWWVGNELVNADLTIFLEEARLEAQAQRLLVSAGPTAVDVQEAAVLAVPAWR